MLGQAAAYAASLDDALSHFTADDFSETSTGISDLATSGSPRAEIIIRALQDGRLLFSAERKTVYVKDEAGKANKYTIVGSAEAKPAESKLSNESPVGKALVGRKRGDEVTITTPRGERRLKITKIDVGAR